MVLRLEETKKKIRLVHIVEAFGGGVFTYLELLLNHLPPELFDITLIHSFRPETPKDYKNRFLPHIRLIDIPMTRKISLFKDLKALLMIVRLLKKLSPDVVHLHSSKAGFLGRLACKINNVNHVYYSPHGFSFLQPYIAEHKRKLYFWLEKIATKFGGSIIAVSKSEETAAKKLIGNVYCINNFIEVLKKKTMDAEKMKQMKTKIQIGTLGRIVKVKNPALFNELALDNPDKLFIWIGDGELRDLLTAPNIVITGFLTREEAYERLNQLDIYVQLSYMEGMPLSVMEAMAMGKPVIASKVVGNKDLIINGINGYLFDLDKEQDAHQLINMLSNNKELREYLGCKARKYIVQNYDVNNAIKKYIQLYTEP